MNKIHFIGKPGYPVFGYVPEHHAIDYLHSTGVKFPRTKDEYLKFVEENVCMSVSKRGREYFTVDVPLSNSGRG